MPVGVFLKCSPCPGKTFLGTPANNQGTGHAPLESSTPLRIERAQPHSLLERSHCHFRFACPEAEPASNTPIERRVRINPQGTVDQVASRLIIATHHQCDVSVGGARNRVRG